jgi:hypothetical protein
MAVTYEGRLRVLSSGFTRNPKRLMTSAINRPPLRASPTTTGASQIPVCHNRCALSARAACLRERSENSLTFAQALGSSTGRQKHTLEQGVRPVTRSGGIWVRMTRAENMRCCSLYQGFSTGNVPPTCMPKHLWSSPKQRKKRAHRAWNVHGLCE